MTGQGRGDAGAVGPEDVRVAIGEVVEVTVADLPGAGYRWVVREVPDGLTVLDEEPAEVTDTHRVGGPSHRAVRLRADLPGSFDLELALVRPWEPADVAPVETRALRVRVS